MALQTELTAGSFHIRINWLIAACVTITALGLCRLGLWQLDRAAEKVAEQQELRAEQEANADPIESIPDGHLHRANPELQNRHVSLQGEYLNDRTILLLAEFFDDQIGYGVVTPLRLQSNGQLVLVHRGWTTGILPAGMEPITRPVEGFVDVKAQIYVPPEDVQSYDFQVDPNQWPLRLRTLDFDIVEEILGEEVFPYQVRLTEEQAGVLVRHWPAVVADVNQHLFYAVQWFSFGLIVIFVALLASSNLWQLMKGPDPSIADSASPE